MKAQLTIQERLTRARTQLLLKQPFFGTLSLRLKLLPGPVATMATDGTRIFYNAAFVDKLTAAELEGVLGHEVLHCALGHHCRRGTRDPQLWNEAADLAINPILLKNSLTLPAGVLLDPAYDNLSAEEIYAHLAKTGGESGNGEKANGSGGGNQSASAANGASPTQPPQPPSGLPSMQATQPQSLPPDLSVPGQTGPTGEAPSTTRVGGFGEVLDATDDQGAPASPAEQNRQQHDWAVASEQAIRMAKTCGHEPSNLERPLSEVRESRQDWRAVLRDFVAATTPTDYRWTPPNRRHVASGLYLPSIKREGVGPIVIAVDTSGSIGPNELDQFAGEISAICVDVQPEAIYVVYCDAAVQSAQQFGPTEPVKLEPKGGGGTDFRPAFEWVDDREIAPACLVYLTDLCCESYPQPPEYPVLWGTDSRRVAPFGETIRIAE